MLSFFDVDFKKTVCYEKSSKSMDMHVFWLINVISKITFWKTFAFIVIKIGVKNSANLVDLTTGAILKILVFEI